jgi:hypothetical protein
MRWLLLGSGFPAPPFTPMQRTKSALGFDKSLWCALFLGRIA